MAKAVYAPANRFDPVLMAEVVSLRARVAQLQRELDALRVENLTLEQELQPGSVVETVLA